MFILKSPWQYLFIISVQAQLYLPEVKWSNDTVFCEFNVNVFFVLNGNMILSHIITVVVITVLFCDISIYLIVARTII